MKTLSLSRNTEYVFWDAGTACLVSGVIGTTVGLAVTSHQVFGGSLILGIAGFAMLLLARINKVPCDVKEMPHLESVGTEPNAFIMPMSLPESHDMIRLQTEQIENFTRTIRNQEDAWRQHPKHELAVQAAALKL